MPKTELHSVAGESAVARCESESLWFSDAVGTANMYRVR